MRISIDPKDVGYEPYQAIYKSRRRVSVFLDGEMQPGTVVTADQEAGFVLRYVTHRAGNGILVKVWDPARPGVCLTEEVRGHVELVVSEDPAAAVKKDGARPGDQARIDAARLKRARKAARLARIVDAPAVPS
jgi:hypothetical protein